MSVWKGLVIMKHTAFLVLLLMVLTGCQDLVAPKRDSGSTGSGPSPSGEPQVTADQEVTIGDVEQKVFISTTLEEGPGFTAQEFVDPRSRVTMVTANVASPAPSHLNIVVRMKAERNFLDTPVVMRGKVVCDAVSEPLATFTRVFGQEAVKMDELVLTTDLMKALTDIPDTTLVTTEIDTLLLPKGTDEATVDPLTATTTPERRTTMLSNPVRINFADDPDKAVKLPVPTPLEVPDNVTPPAPAAPPAATAPTAAPTSDPAAPEMATEAPTEPAHDAVDETLPSSVSEPVAEPLEPAAPEPAAEPEAPSAADVVPAAPEAADAAEPSAPDVTPTPEDAAAPSQ